jgi:hypothetical protein
VSDTCGCPSLLLLWLACHSDYRYFFTSGNAPWMQAPSNSYVKIQVRRAVLFSLGLTHGRP